METDQRRGACRVHGHALSMEIIEVGDTIGQDRLTGTLGNVSARSTYPTWQKGIPVTVYVGYEAISRSISFP